VATDQLFKQRWAQSLLCGVISTALDGFLYVLAGGGSSGTAQHGSLLDPALAKFADRYRALGQSPAPADARNRVWRRLLTGERERLLARGNRDGRLLVIRLPAEVLGGRAGIPAVGSPGHQFPGHEPLAFLPALSRPRLRVRGIPDAPAAIAREFLSVPRRSAITSAVGLAVVVLILLGVGIGLTTFGSPRTDR
jgi:hypothetical protein